MFWMERMADHAFTSPSSVKWWTPIVNQAAMAENLSIVWCSMNMVNRPISKWFLNNRNSSHDWTFKYWTLISNVYQQIQQCLLNGKFKVGTQWWNSVFKTIFGIIVEAHIVYTTPRLKIPADKLYPHWNWKFGALLHDLHFLGKSAENQMNKRRKAS